MPPSQLAKWMHHWCESLGVYTSTAVTPTRGQMATLPPDGPTNPPGQPRFLGWVLEVGLPEAALERASFSGDGSRKFPQPPVPQNVSKETETSTHASASLQRMTAARFPSGLPPRPCPRCHTSAGWHVSWSAWAAAWWPAPRGGPRGLCCVSPRLWAQDVQLCTPDHPDWGQLVSTVAGEGVP